ncbi:magnesium/cobalt transporter CorA [Pedobacter sp.]|uniref:magnesium/cobalt transporter CorA n=1 Tax=Pedobacter sp. TaxID=1411316 RepID=UPI003D7FFE3A
MAKNSKGKKKRKYLAEAEAGSSPGSVYIDENALKTVITIHSYNSESYSAEEVPNLKGCKERLSAPGFTFWVEIKGFKSKSLFEVLYSDFNINKLILEDITSTYQRPIFEEYDHYNFAVSRMLYLDTERNLGNDQASFILMEQVLFTFQEGYENCLSPVKKRLSIGKGNIRTAGSSYLMYALMDVIIDQYFVILGKWGDDLDEIEDRLLDKPDRSIMYDIQQLKRNLIHIRRAAWPERDKLNDILRTDSPYISAQTKMFVKDAYDHCIQSIDIMESLKEIAASNLDMYLSIISNRMNEIMKVLTIVSSIFIPLTFIAGIYGMNFAKEDPVSGKLLPLNMPELYADHGYIYTMVFMAIIAIAQLIYFWRKGWFK